MHRQARAATFVRDTGAVRGRKLRASATLSCRQSSKPSDRDPHRMEEAILHNRSFGPCLDRPRPPGWGPGDSPRPTVKLATAEVTAATNSHLVPFDVVVVARHGTGRCDRRKRHERRRTDGQCQKPDRRSRHATFLSRAAISGAGDASAAFSRHPSLNFSDRDPHRMEEAILHNRSFGPCLGTLRRSRSEVWQQSSPDRQFGNR